jgi:hypothetical protein
MKIKLVQGDASCIYKFKRKDADSKVISTRPQKMWITFKDTCACNDALFQKTLENGITYNEQDNYYRFQLLSEDTHNLAYGIYGFDIAIINESGEKKTLLTNGTLEILKHYTKKCNEV